MSSHYSRATLAQQTANSPDRAASILLVDDDAAVIQFMGRSLSEAGRLRFAGNGQDALRLAHQSVPDLIIVDAEMPGMNGFELLKAIKADPVLVDVPVIFITSHIEADFEVIALQMGAADFIPKPLRAAPVLARVKTHLRLKQLTDQLRRAATTDVLTGIANRRRFEEILELDWLHSRRTGEPIALLLVDVDHFKKYNDRYGHPEGDTCLRKIAMALQANCQRPTDLVARHGGEEFAVLLPDTPFDGATRIAAGVLESVLSLSILHDDSPSATRVSVSIGVGYHANGKHVRDTWDPDALNASDLVLAADRALYAAKTAGRAQVRFRDINDRS
jgi:diguanylate cyclase (GGDEF)-like protein